MECTGGGISSTSYDSDLAASKEDGKSRSGVFAEIYGHHLCGGVANKQPQHYTNNRIEEPVHAPSIENKAYGFTKPL